MKLLFFLLLFSYDFMVCEYQQSGLLHVRSRQLFQSSHMVYSQYCISFLFTLNIALHFIFSSEKLLCITKKYFYTVIR